MTRKFTRLSDIAVETDAPVPRLAMLSRGQMERIHLAALATLESVGVRITTDAACDLLVSAGCRVLEEDIVSIPRGLVEDAIARAPARFTIHDRAGGERMRIGEGRTYVGTGVTALFYLDPKDGVRREFTLEHVAEVARLTDAMAGMDFATTPGVVRPDGDVPIELVNHYEFLEMVTNTTKPLMVLTADGRSLSDVLEMASIAVGGREAFVQRPFVVPYLNSVSPLVMNEETLDKLLIAADWGIPVVCQGAPIVGASAPVTIASTLVLAAAETLCGLVIAQLRRPGTPYISGTVPFIMDMRTGNVASSGPQMLQEMIAMIELCRYWGIPSLAVGAGGDSKAADEQAAMEPAFYLQAAMLSGADLVFDAGNIECGLIFSPEVAIYAAEVIGMYRRLLTGLALDDGSLALDVIAEVKPGGFFLAEDHTLAHFRELWEPSLLSWEARTRWDQRGSLTMKDRARVKALGLLAEHRADPLAPEVQASMQAVIAARRATID